MTEQKTLTSAAIAAAASKQAARVAGSMPKAATKKATRFDRSKPDQFNPALLVAWQNRENKDDITACWLKEDGKTPDPRAQAEYQFPPMLIGRGSKIYGEGDAFKDVPNKKGVRVSRGSAHFRLLMVKEVSDEMAEVYPDWRERQEKCVSDVRAASLKLITDTFAWKNPPNNWVPFINNAWKAARNAIAIPNRKSLSDADVDDLIEASAELKKELRELALAYYIKEARYPFKPVIDDATKLEKQPLTSIESKVYATAEYKEDVYFNDNKGPDDIAFPSDNEHIGHVIEIMRTLPGKGGKGVDMRQYTPIEFVNLMAKREPTEREKKAEKKAERERKALVEAAKREGRPLPPPPPKKLDPIADRPNVTLEDGTVVPDYWWNPTTKQNGKPVQSYGVAVAGFHLTASELGGYGVKFVLRDRRRVYVMDFEDVPDREIEDRGKRVHAQDSVPAAADADDADADDSSEEAAADVQPEKRRKIADESMVGAAPPPPADAEQSEAEGVDAAALDDDLAF